MRKVRMTLLLSVLGAGVAMFFAFGGAATGATKKATGKPIVIGLPATLSGAQASSFLGIKPIVNIWTKLVNDEGGINGHPVKVVVTDNGGDPTKALKNVKQLVEQDKVRAIVGSPDNFISSWSKYITEQKVPVIGAAPHDPTAWTSPNFFPTGGSLPALLYGVAAQAKRDGKNKFTVTYCAEAPVCAFVPKIFDAILKTVVKSGEVIHDAAVSGTAPNYTAQCLAGRSAGANAMLVINADAVVARYVADCSKQGFKPKQYNIAGDVGPVYTKLPEAEGTTVMEEARPLNNKSNAADKRLHNAIKKYDSSFKPSSPKWNETLTYTWTGLEMFRHVATKEKLTPTSPRSKLYAGLYKVKNETLGGYSVPLTYTKGKPTHNNCVWPVKVTNKLIKPNGKPVCIPASLEAATYKTFGG